VLGWTVTRLWAARGALLRGQAPAWWWGLALLLPWSGLLLAVVSDLFIPGSPVYLRIGFANALAMPDNYIPLTLLLLVWGCWISGTLALRTAQGVARPAKG
jgi:hypothetical protein